MVEAWKTGTLTAPECCSGWRPACTSSVSLRRVFLSSSIRLFLDRDARHRVQGAAPRQRPYADDRRQGSWSSPPPATGEGWMRLERARSGAASSGGGSPHPFPLPQAGEGEHTSMRIEVGGDVA